MPIAVVSIPVTDQDRALAFYRDVIGLKVIRDEAAGPAMRWLQLQPSDGGPTVALVTWFAGMAPGGLQGLMFHVADIEGEVARMGSAGGECAPLDEQPWGRFTTMLDPDGNGLIIAQLSSPGDIRTH
jgi:predicted enzyme related to lactoylglutathione lyase